MWTFRLKGGGVVRLLRPPPLHPDPPGPGYGPARDHPPVHSQFTQSVAQDCKSHDRVKTSSSARLATPEVVDLAWPDGLAVSRLAARKMSEDGS